MLQKIAILIDINFKIEYNITVKAINMALSWTGDAPPRRREGNINVGNPCKRKRVSGERAEAL